MKCYVGYGVLLAKRHHEVGRKNKSLKFWLLVGKHYVLSTIKEQHCHKCSIVMYMDFQLRHHVLNLTMYSMVFKGRLEKIIHEVIFPLHFFNDRRSILTIYYKIYSHINGLILDPNVPLLLPSIVAMHI